MYPPAAYDPERQLSAVSMDPRALHIGNAGNGTNAVSGHSQPRAPFIAPTAPTSSVRSTTPASARPPRSRRYRPCDQCRRAKARCAISTEGPPCGHCLESKRDCTFDAAPPARKPRASTTADAESITARDSASPDHRARRRRGSTTPETRSTDRRSMSPYAFEQSRSRQESSDRTHADMSRARTTRPSALNVPLSSVSSFDHLAKSDKYDAHVLTVVLTDDLLPIADGREGEQGERTHVKQISQDPKRPIFVVMDPKPELALTHIHALLRNHPAHLSIGELHDLYHRQVNPALPILPRGSTESQPPLLLGSIIATSLSHSKRTRELAAPVAGMLEISYAGLGEHNLAGVASAVLELGMRGVNSSRASYLLLAKTIALAQLLGMHISPKSWTIPSWEQELRIRLWWMLCIHDGWMSFLNSRPSHVQAHNSTVPLPDRGAILDAASSLGSASSDSSSAFLSMCNLSTLIHKLQQSCCTLGSVHRSSTAREEDVADLYVSSEKILRNWRGHIAGTTDRVTGVNSLLVHLLGFRCMLMRIRLEVRYGLSSPFTPESSHIKPFHELVDFVQLLDERDMDGYWLIYAGHILSSVVSSLIRLSMASPGELNQEAMGLLSRLLRKLGRLHTDCGWDLAAPAVRRAAAMAKRLKSMNEHEALVNALLGTDSSPLAFLNNLVDDPALFNIPGQETALGEVEPQMTWDWNGMDMDFTTFNSLLPMTQ